jgi:hypothetical protein
VHSVILATVDNASRRRGFVVMSTHADAKAAMDNLSRAEIKSVYAGILICEHVADTFVRSETM